MSLDALDDDEVVALRFDVAAVAQEIAAWCGGKVEHARGADGDVVTTVWVPTAKGSRPALLGDWVVRRGEEDHTVMDGVAFAARHAPS